MKLHFRRPSYAEVAATLALLVAMSGTAYAANTVGTSDIIDGAVTTPKLADEAVTNAKVGASAIDDSKLASGAVTHTKIAANSITSGDVENHSLKVADLAGTDASGNINFTLNAKSCGQIELGVSGVKPGQAAFLTWSGSGNPISGIVFGPLKVVKSGTIATSACNMTSHKIIAKNIGVRVIVLS